jgi:antitoxin MazE
MIDISRYAVYTLGEVIKVFTTIQKWGNSQAVRLPKAILEKAGLNENDNVELMVKEGNIIVSPCNKHLTLKERFADYQGNYEPNEWDTGRPVGKEIW